jgi:hypothetical protein
VLRTITEVSGYAYSMSDDAVWVNLYGGSTLSTELNGKPLVVTQETKYPWDGRVSVTLQQCPDAEFALKLRIPGWAEKASIRVNGEPADTPISPGAYADIRRRWRPGDVVELALLMPARLIEANPLVEETRNQVAVQRGPIVYCLESPDLPAGVRVADVVVPADTKFTARFVPDLLQGVAVVEADVVAQPAGDWDDALYRPLSRNRHQPVRVRFIPYYAWSNRGRSEMTVWLPVK